MTQISAAGSKGGKETTIFCSPSAKICVICGPTSFPVTPDFSIRPATEADVPLVLSLIRELAEFERLSHEVVADEPMLRDALFGPRPAAEVLLGFDADGTPLGFALFFQNFSTFLARRGLYLEDLFVRPAFRGRGLGRALIVQLARLAVARGCGRLEWAVLDWNENAIGFYKKLGARVLEDWRICRVTGDALRTLGQP